MKLELFFFLLCLLEILCTFAEKEMKEIITYRTSGNNFLEKSVLVRRLLLVITIDGTIFAFDKYSGAYLWMNNEVGGPLVNRTANPNVSLESPSYFLEPLGDGTIYAYTQDSGLLKLPINIKKLVSQAPSQWPDGTVFLGHKSTLFFAIRLSTGELLFKYSPEDVDFVPSPQLIDAFSGSDPDVLLFSRTIYQLNCFTSRKQTFEWKLSYSEFSSCNSPFDDDQKSFSSPDSTSRDQAQRNIILYSSINRFLVARDPFTLEILWVRRFASIPLTAYRLKSPDSTWRNLFGPLLQPILFTARPRMSGIDPEELQIYLGQEFDTYFVLPTDIFTFYRHAAENVHLIGESEGSAESVFEEDSQSNMRDNDCAPGSQNYPACLTGVHSVHIVSPIPLLSEGSQEKIYSIRKHLLVGLLSIAVVVASLFFMSWRRLRVKSPARSGNDSMGIRPPGFETISISSADTIYKMQDEDTSMSPPKNFVITDEVIGYGSHGTVVFKGEFGGRPVAVKRMLSQFFELAGHEVALLQETDHHPNVIRYYCKEHTDKFTYIVLELCKYSLADLIEDRSTRLNDPISLSHQKILFQITSGLAHLHEMKLIHRDLKPQNILVTMQNKLVISDFGLGKKLAEGQSSFNPTVQAGTVGWRAPECILLEELERLEALQHETSTVRREVPKLSRNIDIFALGCIFFYVLTEGDHPFGNRLHREVNILSGKSDLSAVERYPEAHDLISRMIAKKATDRPSCDQILGHPYFWEASKQISFILDLSDRFEYEDRLSEREILNAFERRRKVIFEGNSTWNRLIDPKVWEDLLSFRKYNAHSARDLLRAIRNKKSHFHELSAELRAILGATPEAFMSYFLQRFPRLLIEAFHVVESTDLKNQNPFCTQYFT